MLNIAIDGPSGAGKSTISKMLAKKLGIIYLDTGAMYRAVALYVSRKGVDVNDRDKVVPLLTEIEIEFRGEGDEKRIYLNGEDVSAAIREHAVSKMASDVSKIKEVRLFLVEQQRAIAKKNDVVLDGRDITSFVLPDSKYKFFLTATPEERARRRYEELKAKGSDISYETVLADVNDRDYNDTHRDFAPLVQTEDAVLIDSTDLSTDEVIEVILRYVNTH
ncbi:MAG TPA: (d)CMP kinase [Candidatus Ornithoclostridium faecavium]|nr:(d)CMP kinase [Candidatus Ornithoclostridium faecavium]